MKLRAPPERGIAGFDITPMIDVTMLLIIFFMMTSQFAQAVRRPVDVPHERGGERVNQKRDLMLIDVLGPDKYATVGQQLDLPGLLKRVGAEMKRTGGPEGRLELVVRADRSSPAAELNRLASGLAGAGVRNWRLATAGESAGEGGP